MSLILRGKYEVVPALLNYQFLTYYCRRLDGPFLVKIRQVYFFWQGWRLNFDIELFQDLMRPSRYYCNLKAKKGPFFS